MAPISAQPQSRAMNAANWCFTLNNYDQRDETKIRAFVLTESHYCVYGKEVGLCGTPHLQGYIELKKRMRLVELKRELDIAAIYLEPRKAKAHQAADYCKKDGDFWECGTEPGQPKKDSSKIRWKGVLDDCKQGNWQKLQDNEPYLWLMQEKKMRSHYLCAKQIDILVNEWIYGPTGTGKSREARTLYPGAYIKDASSHWWDGYNGEEVVIIDDLDKYHVKMGYYLKVWADHYSFPAQIKGGQMMARPKKIIITSNYHPNEIWTDDQTVQPILRRFKLVHKTVFHPFQVNEPDDNFPMNEDPSLWNTIHEIENGTGFVLPPSPNILDYDSAPAA